MRRSDTDHYIISLKGGGGGGGGGAAAAGAGGGGGGGGGGQAKGDTEREEDVVLSRVDYQLPKGSVASDSYSQYVSSLTFSSHWCYWESRDLVLFVLETLDRQHLALGRNSEKSV